jgi:hypothetical protein
MTTVDSCQMEERQLLATLRRDHPGPVTLVGVACNAHVAGAIRDELLRARKRWQQPVHLLIDPRLRCYESEVICSEEAWEERCAAPQSWEKEPQHAGGARIHLWASPAARLF